MRTQVGIRNAEHRGNGGRRARRVVGVAVVAVALLLVAPGAASAKPKKPSPAEISAAQRAKDDAARRVGEINAQMATAQAQIDTAHAKSAIALDHFQGKQAEYEAAQADAEKAAAAARQAEADLGAARDDVAAFARSSYMQRTTAPGLVAVMSAEGPAQLLERAALLQSAGNHRTDVLAVVTVAQQQAAASESAAKTAEAHAETLKQEAEQALTVANDAEVSARQQAATVEAQQTQLQAELQQAQQTLLGLQGAKAAAEKYEQQQAAAAAAAQKAQAEAAARAAANAAKSSSGSSGSSGSGGGSSAPSAGAGSSSAARTAINAAMRWLGTRYAWGGGSLTGPSRGWGIDAGVVGFDCSGLTRYAYAQAGIIIERNSSAQYATLPKVSKANLQPGDLVFWALNSNPATIHHVAIWLGDDQIIEAPESGKTVRVTDMRWTGYIGAVRPSA